MRETLESLKDEIEANGGTVLDFGFHISRPRKSKVYKDNETGLDVVMPSIPPGFAPSVIGCLRQVVTGPSNVPF
jgi:hypothetical protein